MIGHHKKIKRPLQARPNAIAGNDRFTFGEAVRIIRAQFVPEHARIGRETGMAVGIPEKDLVGVVQFNKRGILGVFIRKGVRQLSRLNWKKIKTNNKNAYNRRIYKSSPLHITPPSLSKTRNSKRRILIRICQKKKSIYFDVVNDQEAPL